ncbi:MAG TPA: anti-sigma factor antagonist [Candidatus Pullilachnospira stercoravium]|uniref:Anti-sigma factor antagonist n=1 Tax=Candidatus Pullilachnospira stercoravium TaxID=2840913 RepID=A0A9D1NVM3_9FIRM|nr:anti-sigma factor antagonist [Candidatus Pullilachnospira stercoravium]
MEQFQVKQRTLIVRMPKELDHHMAEQIRRRADRMIAAENVSRVEFDFRDTDFMDSSGIGVIMGRYQNVRLLGGGVAATHVNDRIYRVLHLAGLTRLIEVKREKMWNRDNE